MAQPSDEFRRTPGPERLWADAWEIDFVGDAPAAGGWVGGFVRLTLLPSAGVAWWWTGLLTPWLVAVRDHEVPLPRTGLEVRADGLWGELVCETPLEHWSIGLEAFGLAYDDPADAWGDEWGERLPVGLDLEWEVSPTAARLPPAGPAPASHRPPAGDLPGPGDSPPAGDLPGPGDSPPAGDLPGPGDSPPAGDLPRPGDSPPAGPAPGPGGLGYSHAGRIHGEILVGSDRIPVTGTGFRSRASGVLDWWAERPQRRLAWVTGSGAGAVVTGPAAHAAAVVLGQAPVLVTAPGRPAVRLARALCKVDGPEPGTGGLGWAEWFPAAGPELPAFLAAGGRP